MDIDKKAVGRRISLIRKNLGLTMEEFGKLTNNALKSNVSKWEKGASLPNSERLKRIAELGNIEVKSLLYGDASEYLEAGKSMFNSLLKEFDETTQSGIALRYFEEEERDKIIIKSINSLINAPIYNGFQVEGSNFLYFKLLDGFEQEYKTKVKNNQNLISKYKSGLTNLGDPYSYIATGNEAQFHLDEFGYSIIVEDYEASIDDKLLKELNDIITDTKNKLDKLSEKYPNKPKNIGTRIFAIPDDKNEGFEVANIVDNEDKIKNSEFNEVLKNALVSFLPEIKKKMTSEDSFIEETADIASLIDEKDIDKE